MATAPQIIRRPADPHPQPIALTQHQMVNIGRGKSPDAPIQYIGHVWYPHLDLISPRKVKLVAMSREDAEAQLQASHPKAIIDSLHIAL